MNLSQNKLALELKLPARRINEIVPSKGKIMPDTAMRRAKYFIISTEFWLGLQTDYDLETAADEFSDKNNSEVGEYRTG